MEDATTIQMRACAADTHEWISIEKKKNSINSDLLVPGNSRFRLLEGKVQTYAESHTVKLKKKWGTGSVPCWSVHFLFLQEIGDAVWLTAVTDTLLTINKATYLPTILLLMWHRFPFLFHNLPRPLFSFSYVTPPPSSSCSFYFFSHSFKKQICCGGAGRGDVENGGAARFSRCENVTAGNGKQIPTEKVLLIFFYYILSILFLFCILMYWFIFSCAVFVVSSETGRGRGESGSLVRRSDLAVTRRPWILYFGAQGSCSRRFAFFFFM